jgi:hypothetical protein
MSVRIPFAGPVATETATCKVLTKCPECGADLQHVDGCVRCRECGYSACG